MGALLSPHPTGPQPSALGDFSVPTAEEGRAIPVVAGTVMIKGGNTVWWGDLLVKPIKQGILATILAFGRSQTLGYQYFLGCQFVLCQGPVDVLVSIQADVKDVSYTSSPVANGNGSENYALLTVNSPNLFGGTGPGGGGGMTGLIDFYRGVDTQQPDDYLTRVQGRIVVDQSGLGYTYSGVGNGTITSLSGGASAKDETITITAVSIDGNSGHSTFQKMKFSIVGSVSGTMHNLTNNSDGSNDLWADQAFSSPEINLTINTGSIQFAPGDQFVIKTLHALSSPAYPGLCYAAFRQFYFGTSPYLKPTAFILRSCPDPLGLGSSIANINGDANAACWIYAILNSDRYGLGRPTARIDSVSFTAAAITLASEGLGISMQFDRQASADQLIGEILRHIDGVLYTDPATGLWTLKLARADYDPTTVPVLTVDSADKIDLSRASWEETTNYVNIKFLSRANNFNPRMVTDYDPANIQATNEVRVQTIEFMGISQESTAALVATRVLKTLSYPLAKMKIIANRSAWNFRPGGVFKFTWTPLGISNQIFRITKIGYGELADGKITIDCVEDIFGINNTAFVPPPISGWVNPLGAPVAPVAQELVELPYHFKQDGIYALALCARGDGTSKSFQIWENDGAGYYQANEIFGFAPIGKLSANYVALRPAIDSTGFSLTLAGQVDLGLIESVTAADLPNGKLLVLIDSEIMSVETLTQNSDGTVTISGVMGGVCDTVPSDHASGATVWFISEGAGTTKETAYGTDLTVTAKLLPSNSLGVYPLTSASSINLTTRSRFARPYPPANIRMQAGAFNQRYTITDNGITASWSSRNRLTQTAAGTLVNADAGDITPEVGTTYTAVVSINGVVVRTVTGISAESFTYTGAMRVADDPVGTHTVSMQIFSHANGLDSFMANFLPPALMTGFGMLFGEYFGGFQQ